ncbi:MAG TPA: cytochrome P450 [Gaiellales bacterium]|nr:cytochrome P450 [Gaiellales bacterium]
MSANAPAIDFENDAFTDEVPYAMFDWLRQNDPVRWYDWPHGRGYWAITRHDDLVAVHKDTKTFSSETGATALEDLAPDAIEARKSMIDTDPPRHTRLRGLVNREFTPRAVAAYENLLRELTRVILDEALPLGEFDFVEHVAAPLPIQVLCRILGVPPEDNLLLIDWGDRMIGSTDPAMSDMSYEHPDSDAYRLLPFRSPAAVELWRYGHGIAEQRRAEPEDDIVSKLVHAEIDGERLTAREFDVMFLLLVVAGNETTRQAIAHGMLALMEHPEELSRLRDDPSLMPTAVDEIIRWATPVLHFRRTATCDVELRGQTIREGDKVVTWYISANRDELVFDDPYRFDVGRRPNDHVSFGRGGPHFCLGAHLAKLEVKVMFEELLPRLQSIEPAGSPERIRTNFTNAFRAMPVRVVAS